MANAVREMLSAAGVPIDLERTGLLERSLKLQGQVDSLSSKLGTAEKVCIPARQMLSMSRDAWLSVKMA